MKTSRNCLTAILLLAPLSASAAEPQAVREQYEQTTARAISYLLSKGRGGNGSFSSQAGPGVTSLVTTSLLRQGRSPAEPQMAESLKYVLSFVQPDGGIYRNGSLYRNYETSIAILCLAEANRGGKYDEILAGARKFIRQIQWDEGEGKDASDTFYGGAGYGKHKRPDLSNTSYLIDALATHKDSANSDAMKRAIAFVSRCQNHESEHNTTPFAAKNPDGGFYYTPAAGGTSQAGITDAGGLRSYGSMTYAGLKSMIYAGVDRDDQRVKAAFAWIQKNYRLDANPGMGNAGLFYYFHTFAKALDAIGEDVILDEDGTRHDWRAELIAELARRQEEDGSWINGNERWLEGDANLVTAYALLALSYCKPK